MYKGVRNRKNSALSLQQREDFGNVEAERLKKHNC